MTVIATVVEVNVSEPFIIGRPRLISAQQMNIRHFQDLIREKYGMKAIVRSHPIPQKYYAIHTKLGTWESLDLSGLINPILANEKTRLLYD